MPRYWVLKTTDDGDIDPATGEAREHWGEFLNKQVVAIGWKPSPELHQRKRNPTKITPEEWLEDLTSHTYANYKNRDARARNARPKILKFIHEMSADNGVFLCRGYNATQDKDVHVYGFAKIKGQACYDEGLTRWPIQRQASVWEVEREVSVVSLREMLAKSALTQTIHEISETSFRTMCRLLDFSYPYTSG